jgi:uncharacterized protein
MPSARFLIRIPDLESGPKVVRAPIAPEWIDEVLDDTEVRHSGGPGELSLSVTKNGQDVLVRGKLTVTVQVPCARTLDPAVYQLNPEIFLMLSPGKRGQDRGKSDRHRPERVRADGTRRGDTHVKSKGSRGSGQGGGWEADPELSDENAATDTYVGDEVVLDPFLREFILLEVPMVPLREDLRNEDFEARPPLPESLERTGDPRLSSLALLKDRLEKKD